MTELHTDRLYVRRFLPEDWSDLYEYLSKPEVVRYEPYEAYTVEDCVEAAKERSTEEKNRFWAVCLNETNKMIGHLYFSQEEPEEFNTWELGYVFNPAFYGQGYATEACECILKYGFEEKRAHRIIAGVNVINKASWRVLERLKMRREGHSLQNVFFKRNEKGEPIWNDSYQYGILFSEYSKTDIKDV